MKSILFLFLIATATLPGCKSLQAPKANTGMLTEVYEGMALTNALYVTIANSDDKSYSVSVNKYKQIDSLIDDMLAKDKAREHGDQLVKMDENIQILFAKYEGEHNTNGSISNSAALSYSEYMKGVWMPRYNSEARLK